MEALRSEGEGRLYAIDMVVMAMNASQEYQEAHLNKKQQMGQLQEMINHFWYSWLAVSGVMIAVIAFALLADVITSQ